VALLHLKRTAAISAVESHLIERVNGRFGPLAAFNLLRSNGKFVPLSRRWAQSKSMSAPSNSIIRLPSGLRLECGDEPTFGPERRLPDTTRCTTQHHNSRISFCRWKGRPPHHFALELEELTRPDG
jgi:hypothetical protein